MAIYTRVTLLFVSLVAVCTLLSARSTAASHSKTAGKVYIALWFDTEDYILPESDDAAKRVAELLTRLGVRATFKVVGEKARTLERRKRTDVIAALKKHEIGYHSDNHSQHPTPAEYTEPLDWKTGVTEFTRRERPGFEDVRRIFGQKPSCYGQPGSSWTPQSYASLKDWGVGLYLDEARQVGLNGKPFYFGGLLNIFNTREGGQLRANEDWSNLEDAKQKFTEYHRRMTAEGGGIISIFYHPCELAHAEFWDGVNFSRGANPPREEWKLPRMASREEQQRKYRVLEELVTYLKSYPEVQFITGNEAVELYPDRARSRSFSETEIVEIARAMRPEITFQVRGGYALAPSEIFLLLNRYVVDNIGKGSKPIRLLMTPYGPASLWQGSIPHADPVVVSWSQFRRSAEDVASYLDRHQQMPNIVFLGSMPVSPERYLLALQAAIIAWANDRNVPVEIPVPSRALLDTAKHVADDSPRLWDWIIFPEGFRAPNMMGLAKLQAWTLKPALLQEN